MMLSIRINRVDSQRQRAYLDAMEIDVWCLREASSQPIQQPRQQPVPEPAQQSVQTAAIEEPGLKLGPGGGGILLVCGMDTDSASRLANDIARALGSVPVWAWPDTDSHALKLAGAVEENLFTTVAIFGDDLARQFFPAEIPARLQSANVVLLPSMRELEKQADARRTLWMSFCRAGMVSACGDKA